MQATVHILLLAAGASSRMQGADKLLQPIDGQPILRRVAKVALATGCPVVVTLPPTADARRAALLGLPVQVIEVTDAQQGMSRSICRGLAAVLSGQPGQQDGVMILPADMPDFSTPALANLVRNFQDYPHFIWRGTSTDGLPGHPAIFPKELWTALQRITGDEGGRSVLQAHKHRIRTLPLPGQMATLDLDTPEDWAAYLGRPI